MKILSSMVTSHDVENLGCSAQFWFAPDGVIFLKKLAYFGIGIPEVSKDQGSAIHVLTSFYAQGSFSESESFGTEVTLLDDTLAASREVLVLRLQ